MNRGKPFQEHYSPEPNSGCWLWLGSLNRDNGYGRFYLRYKSYLAHRFSYELQNGPIQNGLVLDHLCRNTSCVNPKHLEVVTNKENILRGISPSAENKRKTHCPIGHEYTEKNTRISKTGKRSCRTCDLIRWNKRKGNQ
jgi:hypothetical protein